MSKDSEMELYGAPQHETDVASFDRYGEPQHEPGSVDEERVAYEEAPSAAASIAWAVRVQSPARDDLRADYADSGAD